MKSRIMSPLLTFPLLLALSSGAITPPNVSVRIVGPSIRVQQGQAAYVDFSDRLTEHVLVICTWNVLDTLDTLEIWVENGSKQRTLLLTDSTRSYIPGRSRHIVTAAEFQSGKYGCAVRSGSTAVDSQAFVYLFTPPKPVVTQSEDARIGGSAVFTCNVEDNFTPFVTDREIDYLFKNGSDTLHEMSSWTQGEWKVEGHKLTIANLQEWAKDVTVLCRVKGAKVHGSIPVHNGNFFWSDDVAISFAATPPTTTPTPTSTPPTTTPTPTSTPPTAPAPDDALSSPLVTMVFGSIVFLTALALLLLFVVLLVVLMRRTSWTYGHGAERRLLATPCLDQQHVCQASIKAGPIQYNAYNGRYEV